MKRKKIFWTKKGFICCIPIVVIIIVLILLAIGVINLKDIISWLGVIVFMAICWYIWKLWKEIKLDEKKPRYPNHYERNVRLP